MYLQPIDNAQREHGYKDCANASYIAKDRQLLFRFGGTSSSIPRNFAYVMTEPHQSLARTCSARPRRDNAASRKH